MIIIKPWYAFSMLQSLLHRFLHVAFRLRATSDFNLTFYGVASDERSSVYEGSAPRNGLVFSLPPSCNDEATNEQRFSWLAFNGASATGRPEGNATKMYCGGVFPVTTMRPVMS